MKNIPAIGITFAQQDWGRTVAKALDFRLAEGRTLVRYGYPYYLNGELYV